MPRAFIRRLLPVLVAGACLLQAIAQEPAKPRLAVTVFPLGVTGGSITSADMAAALNQDDWCQASGIPAGHWNQYPDGQKGPWLSVVLTGFGDQAQAFAFLFDAPGVPPRLAAHVPYRISWVYRSKVWFVPTGRLAGTIREFYRTGAKPPEQPVLTLAVTERAEAAASGAPSLESLAPVKRASSVTKREALPPLEAMIAGAMLENGLTPTWEPSPQSLQAELRFGFQASSIRLTRQGQAKAAASKDEIPEESYYTYLSRLFYALAAPAGAGIGDFVQLNPDGPLHLLTTTSNRLCLVTERDLVGVDLRTGRQSYPPADDKQLPRAAAGYVERTLEDGVPRLFRITRGLAEVQPATGAETILAKETPNAAWSFATAGDLTILGAGSAIAAFRKGEPAWRQAEAASLSAGPSVQGDRLFAGTEDGVFLCRSAIDGRELWRNPPHGESWNGEVVCLPGRILAYDRTGENLTAFNPADGTVLWKQAVGDVLLKAPFRLGNRLVVAGKNNRLLLLNEADAAIVADVKWPTWLVDVIPVPGSKPLVACSDIHGSLSFLDAATLKPVRTLRLPARPSGPLLFRASFPTAWRMDTTDNEDDDMGALMAGEPKPTVLAGDVDGFCSIVPLP
jgi:hypothetical protein